MAPFKYCIVPCCTSTTVNTPGKLFFCVPYDKVKRDTWTVAMKRDEKKNRALSTKSTHWCCEDHFTLEEDMENYWQWRLTKEVKRFKLKIGVVPHRFECQKKTSLSQTEQKGAPKRKRLALVQEALSTAALPSTSMQPIKKDKMDIDKEAENIDDPEKMEADDITKTNEKPSEQPKTVKEETKSEELLVSSQVESSRVKNDEVRDAGSSNENDDEKFVHLTADEAKQYLLKKIGEYMASSINPLHTYRSRVKELEEKSKEQVEDYIKLYKGLQMLQRKHEIFLRSVEVLPKVTMCHACVSANFPMEVVPNHESLLKKELSITKVTTPTNVSSVQNNSKPAAKAVECIDLTDDDAAPNIAKSVSNPPFSMVKHPAPLPPRSPATSINNVRVPPKPRVKISVADKGIVLQWDMPTSVAYNKIASFEIYGYNEQPNTIINTLLWKKIGLVKAMTLPMACTLTQFANGNKYHFAIRAVDVENNYGHYSESISIKYEQKVP